jgi:hypothetical protein
MEIDSTIHLQGNNTMALNPLYTLMFMENAGQQDLIDQLDNRTQQRFEDYCVANAKNDEDLDMVRSQANETFKWWNPEA